MATISKTVARFQDDAGIRRRVVGQYTGPSSYVTGGDALVAGDINLGTIEFIKFENPIDSTPTCRLVTYDHASGKVIWFDLAGDQIANGVDLDGYSCRFEAIGK